MESGIRNPASVFREYMRLQRIHADVGLTPVEFARWMQLKRALGRHFSPDLRTIDWMNVDRCACRLASASISPL